MSHPKTLSVIDPHKMVVFLALLILLRVRQHQAWKPLKPPIVIRKRTNPTTCWVVGGKLRRHQKITTSNKIHHLLTGISSSSSTSVLQSYSGDSGSAVVSPMVLLFAAISLGVAANAFIQQMLKGDRGLGAFLKDGKGYNKSGFSTTTTTKTTTKTKNTDSEQQQQKRAAVSEDPLPWLKLPKFEYVDVAGQDDDFERTTRTTGEEPSRSSNSAGNVEDDDIIVAQLETLRNQMNEQLEKGNIIEAQKMRLQLESIMEKSGIEYYFDKDEKIPGGTSSSASSRKGETSELQ